MNPDARDSAIGEFPALPAPSQQSFQSEEAQQQQHQKSTVAGQSNRVEEHDHLVDDAVTVVEYVRDIEVRAIEGNAGRIIVRSGDETPLQESPVEMPDIVDISNVASIADQLAVEILEPVYAFIFGVVSFCHLISNAAALKRFQE